jgi:hypothetical protein
MTTAPTELVVFLRSTLDMAEKDLAAGDIDRVQHHLQTVRILLDQLGLEGGSDTSGTPRRGRVKTEEGQRIETAVIEILSGAGRPMHMQEIMAGLEERGVPLPGQGRAANLISHLRRMDRVKRRHRGMYTLE